VNATDATTLANNMGTSTTNTGIATAAQFDAYYLNGNWEKGDHDGNGFINQADADWFPVKGAFEPLRFYRRVFFNILTILFACIFAFLFAAKIDGYNPLSTQMVVCCYLV